MYGVIYTATNRVNGKQYVGQTTESVEKRWMKHVSDANRNRKRECRVLNNAIRKYGSEAFDVEAIIACDSKEELDRMEVMAIASGDTLVPSGYNLKTGGNAGGRPGAETRAKTSAALMGHSTSQETRAKISASNTGKSHSSDTRARISAVQKGKPKRPLSAETRAKISVANKGRAISREHRDKLSEAHRGKVLSLEHRIRIGAANKGKVRSPETRAKISQTKRKRVTTAPHDQ